MPRFTDESLMKILHLVNTLDPRGGGVTEAVIQFCQTLTEAGHHNEIATADPPEAGFSAGEVPVMAWGPCYTPYAYSLHYHRMLGKHAGRFDCAVVHGLWQSHAVLARHVFRGLERPYFVFAHGMLDVWFKQHYPLKHLKKCLFWPWAEYRVLRDARAVIYTSELEQISSRQSFRRYRARECVVRYGILTPQIRPDEAARRFLVKHPELKERRFLLFLGRVHVKKGLDLLTKAWAELPPASRPALVVAGPEQEAGLLAEARRLAGHSGDFHYLGMLHGEQKWGALSAAEAMILPSHQENFGLVVAEAMMMRTPVLISDKVNIWREVDETGSGLVEPDTLEGTRRLLHRWETMSADDKNGMATCADKASHALFDLRKNTAALIRVLEDD